MRSLLIVPVAVTLILYLLPVALFRRRRYQFAREYLVSTSGTTDSVFQNSSLAYAMQLATFGPFFAWGLAGDWLPGVLNSLFFCLGLALLYFGRRQIATFVRGALASDHSITIHEFLAQSHGNSRGVRLVASGLTVVALWGLAMSEMFGIATAVGPLLGSGPVATFVFSIVLLLLMFVYSATGGNDGVMRTDQLQLGVAYLGLFAAVVGLILIVSRSPAVSAAPASMAVCFFFGFAVLWLAMRRFRFLEPIAGRADGAAQVRNAGWQAYLRLEKVLNVLVVASVIGMAVAGFYYVVRAGPSSILSELRNAVHLPKTGMSGLALFAIAILPLGYQVVDITNWQRFAATGDPNRFAGGPNRRALLGYVFEAPLVWIALMAFGTLAGVALGGLAQSTNPFGDFAPMLLATKSTIATVTSLAFVVAVFAIGLSTMDAVFSATQAAFQYDLLPALVRPGVGVASTESRIRLTRIFGLVTYLAVIAMFYVAEKYLSFGRDNYLALLLAFYSAQMAFIPLVVGAYLARRNEEWTRSPVSNKFAILSLLGGATVGIGATVTALLTTPTDLLMWGSIPACLLVSATIYSVGWVVGRGKTAPM